MTHDEVAAYIGSAVDGLAYSETTAEGNVFVDRMPEAPDRAVAVYAQPGLEADSKLPYDPSRFQVVVRSEAGGAWALVTWAAVYAALHALRNVTLPGGTYLAFALATQSSPFLLGPDENGRPLYGVTFRAEVINATGNRS